MEDFGGQTGGPAACPVRGGDERGRRILRRWPPGRCCAPWHRRRQAGLLRRQAATGVGIALNGS